MSAVYGFRLVIFTVAVSLGIFMNVLDTSIANVAIPTIAGNMGVSPDEGTWIITSFTVSMAIVLPLSGWLGKRFGEVKLFVICTLLFTIASVMCGLATSLPTLIVCRVLQGMVAGPMIPLSQSLLMANFPEDKKGLATGLWATVAVAAPVIGPILGGYITDNWKWPWIFYINIPFGLFSAYFTWIILKDNETVRKKLPIDYVGLIFLAIGVGFLQVLLDKGNDLDWFNSYFIRTFAIISFISLSCLIAWELTVKHPIIDLSLFKGINFTVGTIALSLGFMIYFGSVVILPLWLQTQMGYTPTWAGLVTAPLGLIPLILSPIIGGVMERFDLRIITSIGFLVFAVCSFWLANLNTDVSANHIAFIRFLQGFAISTFFVPTIAICLSGLPANQVASASGLANFFRILAGSFGTSISVTLWSRRESFHQSHIVESIQRYQPEVLNALQAYQSLGLSSQRSAAEIAAQVNNQAFMLATNDVFWISGVIFIGLMLLIWLAKPPFNKQKVAVE